MGGTEITVKKIIRSNERRAVAPIIATLLMVAIAVVGGILIFVFAQGFFTDTSIQGPSIDSLDIFGFDARDDPLRGSPICGTVAFSGVMASHTGGCITGVGSAAVANKNILNEGDAILLYVRNSGGKAVTVSSVSMAGRYYTLATGIGNVAATVPNIGEFVLASEPIIPYTGVATADETARKTGNVATSVGGVINPGEEKTLVIRFDSALAGEAGPVTVKIGRNIQVTITTGNGATFVTNIQNGTARGV